MKRLVSKTESRCKFLSILMYVLMILGIFVISLLIMLIKKMTMMDADIKQLIQYIIMIGVIFLLILISCIFVTIQWNLALLTNHKQKTTNHYLVLKEEYNSKLDDAIKNVEYFHHDIKKHFQILDILMASNQQENARSYLESLNVQYSTALDISEYTNNKLLNAILSNKKFIANKYNIKVRITAEKIEYFPIPSYDLCSLFDNLLDNAIEACQKVDIGRFIDIFISHPCSSIHIVVKNSINGQLNIKGKKIITTKKDKMNHGLGIKIIHNIVASVGGKSVIEFDESEGSFTTTIIIPTSKKEIRK